MSGGLFRLFCGVRIINHDLNINPPSILFLHQRLKQRQRRQHQLQQPQRWSSAVSHQHKKEPKKKKKKKSSALKDTIKMPLTEMPLSMKGALEREAMVRKLFDHDSLYSWQEADETRTGSFVLHDGPPYANGNPHVGHALNKIVKDITLRWKILRGFKVNYIPGWDCHGLPIELKALREASATSSEISVGAALRTDEDAISVRDCAKAFADKTIQLQKEAFKSWNIVADWENGCYFSYDPKFEAAQLDLFYQMFRRGCIYQSFMPIYWSPSSQTALAESELEYNENHRSVSIYVKFPIVEVSEDDRDDGPPLNALVWTTTPWTLPANRAICFNPELEYIKVRFEAEDEVYVVAKDCVERLEDVFGKKIVRMIGENGVVASLHRVSYSHPLSGQLPPSSATSRRLPFLPSKHVTTAKGSGLVHAAPAHGHDDYHALRACGLRVDDQPLVDSEGRFSEEAGDSLKGYGVLDEGNQKVIKMLGKFIVKKEDYTHSYPYDWRTKQPVITVASLQWFVRNDMIKEAALKALEDVRFFPDPEKNRTEMVQRIKQRDYWCISRQRVWGLPIPVFYDKITREPLLNQHTIGHLKELFLDNGGSSCWWCLPVADLLPQHVLDASGFNYKLSDDFVRGDDILDIWFDSGSTWKTVVEAVTGSPRSDLYVEGIDQYGGWFLSSLLTCASLTGQSPYKDLLVHGFVVDEEGKKMSKSVGNVVDPQQVIFGDGKQVEGVGVDVLRFWVAESSQRKQTVKLGPNVLSRADEAVFQLRKSLRFVLGNLSDFNVSRHSVQFGRLTPIDQAVMLLLRDFVHDIENEFDNYRYSSTLKRLRGFTEEFSALYLDPVRDRLYCDPEDSLERRSAQSVLHNVLRVLLHTIAPILPHLADEVRLHLKDHENVGVSSIMKQRWCASHEFIGDEDVALASHHRQTFQDCLVVRKYLFSHTQFASHDLKEMDLELEIDSKATGEEGSANLAEMRNILRELLGCATLNVDVASKRGDDSLDVWSLPPLPSIKRLIERAVSVDEDDEDGAESVAAIVEEVEILTPNLSDGTEFRFETRKTAKLACLRCRLFRSESEGALCSRCRTIVTP